MATAQEQKDQAQELTKSIQEGHAKREAIQNQQRQQAEIQKAQDQADLQRAQAEYDQYEKEQKEMQEQLLLLENEEKLRIESEAKAKSDRENITKPYDLRIQELEAGRIEALANVPRTITIIKQGEDEVRPASRKQIQIYENEINQNFDSAVRPIYEQRQTALNYYDYSLSEFAGQPLEASVRDAFKSSRGQASLIDLVRKRNADREARSEYDSQSSIKTAQSNAVKEQTKFDYIIKEYAEKKESNDVSYGTLNTIRRETSGLTYSVRKEPQIYPSTYFKNLKDSENRPLSIIGNTPEKSNQAVETFSNTQLQQKELFNKFTTAENWSEAIDLRTRYEESNPYVGTAMTYMRKGEILNTQGVLIEKVLNDKFESDTIQGLTPIVNPKETPQEINTNITIHLKDSFSGITPHEIPTIKFLDKQGNVKETTPQDIWAYVSRTIETQPKTPTKADQILTKYQLDNAKEIDFMQSVGKYASGETEVLVEENSLMGGIKGHSTELIVMGENILTGKEQKYTPTPEALLTGDLINTGKTLFFGDAPQNSTFVPFIEKKLQEERGADYLLSSGLTSVAVLLAPVTAIPSMTLKFGQKFIQPQTIKEATKIAESLSEKSLKNPELEKLFEKFPALTEAQKNTLRKKNIQTVPYSVEPVKGEPTKALITLGTEASPSKTPILTYTRNTKGTHGKSKTQVYSALDDTPVTPRDVIIKGVQDKELAGGIKVTDDIVKYPINSEVITATKPKGVWNKLTQKPSKEVNANLQKVTDPNSHLAPVGTLENVYSKDLLKNPKQVIDTITEQEVKRETMLLETEHLKYTKGTSGEVKNLVKKGGSEVSDLPKEKPSGGFSTDKINLETPTNQKITLETAPKNPPTSRTEKLKDMAREMTQKETKAGVKTFTASSIIGMQIGNLRQREVSLQESKTELSVRSEQALNLDIGLKTPQKEINITDNVQLSREKLITDLTTKQGQRPALDGRFSLIVRSEIGQRTDEIPKYKIIQKTETIPIHDVPTREDSTYRPPPVTLFTDITIPEDIVGKSRKQKSGKKSVIYWRDDTDTSRVGRDLARAPAFTVSKTPQGSWGKIEKLQRETHKKNYLEKGTKHFNRKLGFAPFLKKKKDTFSWF